MKKFEKVLMFFAHPDDETLAAGGSIAKFTSKGTEVHVAISNSGVYARRKDDSMMEDELEKLRINCREAMALLGVKGENIYLGDFSDNEIDKHTLLSLIQWIEPIIDEVKPCAIFTHHRYCTNIDHQYCHEAAVVATRPGIGFHVPVFCGEIPSSTGYLKPTCWEPNFYVELTEKFVELKILAMQTYKGEARPAPHPRSPEVLRALSVVRGSESGFNYAEAFMVQKMFD